MIKRFSLLLTSAILLMTGSGLAQEYDWTQINLIYNSDVGGKIEPCG